jgi:actin-related protein
MEEPVRAGVIKDFKGITSIIEHLMNNVMTESCEEHKVLITEPPNNDKRSREELVQLMFEEFKVPKLYLGN